MCRYSNPGNSILDLSIAIAVSSIIVFWFSQKTAQNPEMAGLDFLIWLAMPAAFAALYLSLGRLWGSAGLVPRLRGNGVWFLFAFTLPPTLAGLLLLFNQVTGHVRLEPALMQAGAWVGLMSVGVLFIKNIVEEFIFRGFLTERFAQTTWAGLKGHFITGLIWAAWHLVYWFTLLPEGKIAEVIGLTTPVFVIVGFVVLPLQSVLLGELRLVTGSIWAGIVLHTMNNVFLVGLVAAQAVPRANLSAVLLTPIDIGLIYTGAMAVIGLLIWRRRMHSSMLGV